MRGRAKARPKDRSVKFGCWTLDLIPVGWNVEQLDCLEYLYRIKGLQETCFFSWCQITL